MAKFVFFDSDINTLLSQSGKPTGGAAVQSSIWMTGLVELGHTVIIPQYGREEELLNLNKTNINLIHFYDEHKGLRWIRWMYYRFPNIYKKLKKNKPDYLYESIPSWKSFFTAIICRQLRIKFIIRLSSDNILDKRFLENYSKSHHLLLKSAIRSCDYLLCQNDYQYSQAKKLFQEKNIMKIPNPFLFQDITTKRKKTYIAWVANFRYVKNLKLLYEIASFLGTEEFKIAGVYSEKKDQETSEFMEKLANLQNVTFLGHVERKQIFTFLSHAKYLLNTSRYEGFSNTFLEAMSVGTPVLSTSNANPDQIINKNNIGIIYKDHKDLAKQLQHLSAADYQSMSERAINYVKENHDHRSLVKKLLHFLQDGGENKI